MVSEPTTTASDKLVELSVQRMVPTEWCSLRWVTTQPTLKLGVTFVQVDSVTTLSTHTAQEFVRLAGNAWE